MLSYIWVAIGGALGSAARFWVTGFLARHAGETFPWGTLLVNVSGSLIIGFFATITGPDGRWLVGPHGRTFFMIGLCGGYTTFSSLSLETLHLARDGEWFRACANAVVSLLVCLAAVWIGHIVALSVNPSRGA
jgi:fluoride exporter